MMNLPSNNNQSFMSSNAYSELYNNNDVIRSASPASSSSSSSNNDCTSSSQWMKTKKQKKGFARNEEFTTTTIDMKPQAQQGILNREQQEQDHDLVDDDLPQSFSTDPAFAEYLLSSRINQISLEERSQALYDLHGVNHNNEFHESPEFVQQKTQKMNNVLLNLIAEMKPNETSAFRKAVSIDSNYVDSLKLMFLRSESYKPKDASERLLRFFDLKMDLFGEQYLTKDIGLDDLQPEVYTILHHGFIRLLPHRDRAGRAIIMVHGPTSEMFPNNHFDVLKVFFCFIMSILKGDDQSQIHGLVGIYWAIGQYTVIKGRFPLLVRIGKALPWKLVGRHCCRSSNGVFGNILEYFIRNCAGPQLATARFHNGTNMECYYNLMTFGIPKEALPDIINENGDGSTMSLIDHHEMLQTIRNQQRQEKHQQQRLEQLQQQEISLLSTTIHTNVATAAAAANNVITTASSNNPPLKVVPPPPPPPPQKKQQIQKIILVPNPMDVLMGKGHQPMKRPGLLRMQNLIFEHFEEYNTAKKGTKMNVCKLVMRKMKQNYGCRFLMTMATSSTKAAATTTTTTRPLFGGGGGGGYVECTETQALEKISHAFRNLKQKQKRELNKKKNTKQNQQQVQQEDEESDESSTVDGNDDNTTIVSNTNKKKRNLEEAV